MAAIERERERERESERERERERGRQRDKENVRLKEMDGERKGLGERETTGIEREQAGRGESWRER